MRALAIFHFAACVAMVIAGILRVPPPSVLFGVSPASGAAIIILLLLAVDALALAGIVLYRRRLLRRSTSV